MRDLHKVYPARSLILLVYVIALLVGMAAPLTSAVAAAPIPRTPGPHIMPFNPPGTHIKVQSAPSGAHLTYYGGPVISNMKVVMVSYGTGTYIFSGTPATWLPRFVSQYLGSGVLDWLSEYNTFISGGTNQVIGRGSLVNTYTITPSAGNNGSTIQDGQIQAELAAQITGGNLPAPDLNTTYALFFRLGQSICMGGSCSLVAGGFCAYHGTTTINSVVTTYQVMPDLAGTTGCGSSTDLNNTTSVLSHELVETITDPQVGFATVVGPPLAWYDLTNGEIGDICNAQQGSFTGTDANVYVVQQQFSNVANNCIVTRTVVSNDFSISASPSALTIIQGASDTATINTAVTSGSSEIVNLAVSGAPSGVTAGLTPTSVTSGSSSTLTVSVGASAAPGTYTLTIAGTASSGSHNTTVSLTVAAVQANDFSISATPSALTINQGAADSSTVSTTLVSGSAETVSLSVSGAPTGVTASLSPTSVTAGGSSNLSVSVSSVTVPGTYTLTVTGTAASATHATTVSLTVAAVQANDFSISATPSALTINQGAADSSTVSTTLVSGSAETVSLSVSGAPTGVTAGFSPTSVTAGGSSTLTVNVSSSAAAGTYTLTVTGAAASATHTTTISLTVLANDFSISVTPSSLTVNAGASGTLTVSTTALNGFTGTISLSISGMPSGVTAAFNPASVSGSSSSTLTVTASLAAAAGSSTVTVTGTSGSLSHSAGFTLTIAPAVFPANAVLDNFNRTNGGVGSNWVGSTSRYFYQINGNALDVQLGGALVWKPASFGANQEAFVTLSAIDTRSHSQGLLLKVQNMNNYSTGAIILVYDAVSKGLRVSTLRGGSVRSYTLQAVTFANGDQLGARALANGAVQLFKNGALVATITLSSADQGYFDGLGGRIGLLTVNASNAIFDNFGGGSVTLP